jgi:hypothetical protein
MIAKLAGAAIAIGLCLTLLAAGAAGAEWYEHRAPGQPAWARLDLLWWHWRLPDGLAAKAAEDRAALAAAAAALGEARGALARQDAAVLALQRAALQREAAGRAALAAASAALRRETETAGRLLAEQAPAGADELALCRAADRLLLEGAR